MLSATVGAVRPHTYVLVIVETLTATCTRVLSCRVALRRGGLQQIPPCGVWCLNVVPFSQVTSIQSMRPSLCRRDP